MEIPINISTMKELDLFDGIPYGQIKDIINDDEDFLYVQMENSAGCDIGWFKTIFTFEIDINISGKIKVEKHYQTGSDIFDIIMELLYVEESDEESDEESEEESDEGSDEGSDEEDLIKSDQGFSFKRKIRTRDFPQGLNDHICEYCEYSSILTKSAEEGK